MNSSRYRVTLVLALVSTLTLDASTQAIANAGEGQLFTIVSETEGRWHC